MIMATPISTQSPATVAQIADTLHNFSDIASLVIAFAARKIARRPPDERMTFGHGRVEIVAALMNYTTLILIGLYRIYEGGMRIIDPPEEQGWTMETRGLIHEVTGHGRYRMWRIAN